MACTPEEVDCYGTRTLHFSPYYFTGEQYYYQYVVERSNQVKAKKAAWNRPPKPWGKRSKPIPYAHRVIQAELGVSV
jgi:hypothetical protein